jgi:rSAM/selenodomain-associated transferase 1
MLPRLRRALESLMDGTDAKQLLVVVAKTPQPGEVKTRLLTKLTPEEATDLYSCFIRDRIREIGRLKGVDLAIAYTPEASKAYFERFLSNGFRLFPQQGRDLGERLHNIFVQQLGRGYQSVCIIDSDTPDLPRSLVTRAFQWLAEDAADAVFGPCEDGGYYLVGLRQTQPALFSGIPWSTDQVLPLSLKKAAANGLRTRLLPDWNDLDTVDDLLAFYRKYSNSGPKTHLVGRETLSYLSRLDITRQF